MNLGTGRTKDQGDALKRTFGQLSVVDAEDSVRVYVEPTDLVDAEPMNPEHCVLARACRRQFGSVAAVFLGRIAYVELPDEKGRRHVERFKINGEARKLIERFDRGETIGSGAALVLRRPPPSERLDHQRRYQRARERAIAKGTWVPDPKLSQQAKKGNASRRVVGALDVRDGSGVLQVVRAKSR